MNNIFLVEWSATFGMGDSIRFKDLVWANSKEEAKEKILSENEKKVRSEDAFMGIIKVTECIPQNGIFHLGSY